MHEIDIRIRKHVFVLRVAPFDSERVGNLAQLRFIATAQGKNIDVGMFLVNRNEFRTKA